jgi:hypothetical protein
MNGKNLLYLGVIAAACVAVFLHFRLSELDPEAKAIGDRVAAENAQKAAGMVKMRENMGLKPGEGVNEGMARMRRSQGPNPDEMMKSLGLSAEQQAKAKPILESVPRQMQGVFQNQELSREQKREKAQAIRKATDEKLRAILTPEQQKKFEEMQQKMPRPGGMGGAGGGAPAEAKAP